MLRKQPQRESNERDFTCRTIGISVNCKGSPIVRLDIGSTRVQIRSGAPRLQCACLFFENGILFRAVRF